MTVIVCDLHIKPRPHMYLTTSFNIVANPHSVTLHESRMTPHSVTNRCQVPLEAYDVLVGGAFDVCGPGPALTGL